MTHVGGDAARRRTARCIWNPAFDVTPHQLIAGIITERGIFRAPYTESLKRAFESGRRGRVDARQSEIARC